MDELYKVDAEWEWYIGKLFSKLIENNFGNELNTIVEFAPGYRYKIANALKDLNFKGTIYVIDYNENVLKYISLKYKELLPMANIICINKDLDESIKYLPQDIDLFLSNHSLDDMIISEYLTEDEKIEIFNNGDEAKSKLLNKWETLSKDSLNLERIKNIVFIKWLTFFENVNISKVIMSQYKSNDYYINQNNYMDDITRDLFLKIKELIPTKDDYIDFLLDFYIKEDDERFKDVNLLNNTQAAKNWIVGSYTRNKFNIPNSVFLMGKQIFMNTRLYSRKEKLKPIYINKELYEKIFSKPFNFEEASELISNCFSVTIDKNKGDEKSFVGEAFIDFQSDLTDIALNGNKGSGRAYYFDKNYNLKGELTPLATSSNPEYNNGKLSLVSAIHESMISNVLNSDMVPSSFQTLAVFDSNEEYNFVVEGKSAPCGIMIRVTNDSDLYRVSHRFANKKPFKKDELFKMASSFGVLEGNKFIDRFLHGAWSSGNISIEGNMIDFDTSFFTIGRHPQCSYTNKYKTNYFGYEYLGQNMVLDSIVNSSLNIDDVKINELEEILLDKRSEQISIRLFELMGFKKELYVKYKKDMDKLSKRFEFLSKKTFANYALFNVVAPDCINCNVFDFSRLFRYYQLLKNNQDSSLIDYFDLLINKNADLISFPIEKDLKEKIHEYFKDILVNDNLDYTKLLNEVIEFIKEYDSFNEKVIKENDIDTIDKSIYSYLINENRKYLTSEEDMRYELLSLYKEKRFTRKKINEIINDVINFSKRTIGGLKYCDFILFEEGIFYRVIDNDQNSWFEFNSYDIKLHDVQLWMDNIIINCKVKGSKIVTEKVNFSNCLVKKDLPLLKIINDNKEIRLNPIGKFTKIKYTELSKLLSGGKKNEKRS